MKRCLAVLCVFGFLFGLVGSASALLNTPTKTLGVALAEGPIAGLSYPSNYSFSHDTPADFGIPPDKVNSASLAISGYWIDGDDDGVTVEGKATGYLSEGGSQGNIWHWWDTPSVTIFNITGIFGIWNVGESSDVTINAAGGWGDWKLELASSTSTHDYTNSTDLAFPVSESATMLLIGSGMIGLALFGRKKFFTKALA